jgi:sensor domain CHASE-containing protein
MSNSGLLKAALEVVTRVSEDLRKERDTDRRTMAAMMHELEQITARMDEIVPKITDVNKALSRNETGRLLKVRKMAERIDMHPRVVQDMAREGRIPAHRHGELDDWLFDPAEVIAALKSRPQSKGIATHEARERAAADPWVQDAPDYDTYRDRLTQTEHEMQVLKELEQGL